MTLVQFNQYQLFFIFLLVGFTLSIPLSILTNLIKIKPAKIIQIIFDVFSILLITSLYLIISNTYCYGELRFFTLLGLLLGIIIENLTIKKLFGVLIRKLYNILVNITKRLKNTKIYKFLSK